MPTSHFSHYASAALALLTLGAHPLPASPIVGDSIKPAVDPSHFRSLRWRNVGPFRGGRAVAVAGDPEHRLTFYFGAVGGGVWKTTTGGAAWSNITDGHSRIASVGAIAIAPSDANVVYVGGGEADFREDLTYGDGMWRSTDGGESWKHLGLDDARHIAAIRIHPTNPDLVYVAAMGHAFGRNTMRGVYRSADGGRTWKRILFVDDATGAIDLAMDPTNPRILYAAMWTFQRSPWGFTSGGPSSGLWKSLDGGDSWSELTDNPGLPLGDKGRIGVTVSAADPRRLWASVEAKDSSGGIFRSDDAGRTWQRVNGEQKFRIRPWYFSQLFADPADANTVYVLNLGTWRSIDGGTTFTRIRVPHGDCHILWIDPKDSRRMIEGNDGGATISYDRGETWSTVHNQPTAQFYHVTTDNQFPYRLYGAQQDNSTVSIASRSDLGSIQREDFYPVGGGESGYVVPNPRDPNVVYAGTYMGTLTRYDHRTKQARDISIGLNNYDGYAARAVPNRFPWTFPILVSPHDPKTLYVAANRVFRSTDEGTSWTPISADLTVHDPTTLGDVGGALTKDMTGTEWYATVFALAESPVTPGVLWAGSDDGLIHVTRDAGASWRNVTPPELGRFTRVSIIEASHYDAATVYVAANRYQQDDFRPYLFKTTDFGRSWRRIDAGLPEGAYARTVREDPVRRGLLFAGTEVGLYVSFDDGARWQSLQLNLPLSSVRDLHIHGADLIAATHGRAFWVLDGIGVLRQLTDESMRAAVHVFAPDTAVRFAGGHSRELVGVGENPPDGAVIHYWFRQKPGPNVRLTFLDAAGRVVRTFTDSVAKVEGDSTAKPLAAADAVPPRSVRDSAGARIRDTTSARGRKAKIEAGDTTLASLPDSVVPARVGANRFVWDLRYANVRTVKNVVVDEGTITGPVVTPGTYTVRLDVAGKSFASTFAVVGDPRVTTSDADLRAQLSLALEVRDKTSALSDAVKEIETMQKQLDERLEIAKGQPYAAQVTPAATALRGKLEAVRGELAEVHSHADESTLNYPIKLYNKLLSLAAMVQSADAPPTTQEVAVFAELAAAVDAELTRLGAIKASDVVAFNKLVRDLNIPSVGPLPAAVTSRR
ncbi:MAG: hypothetical protein NVS4B3_24770 [Gemmatimonadaceae bacterium]